MADKWLRKRLANGQFETYADDSPRIFPWTEIAAARGDMFESTLDGKVIQEVSSIDERSVLQARIDELELAATKDGGQVVEALENVVIQLRNEIEDSNSDNERLRNEYATLASRNAELERTVVVTKSDSTEAPEESPKEKDPNRPTVVAVSEELDRLGEDGDALRAYALEQFETKLDHRLGAVKLKVQILELAA